MKKFILLGCLILFLWVIGAEGSVKVSYYNLSSIERDGNSAVGKVAEMNLKIISQYDRYKFAAEHASGTQILLNFRGKVKASPEMAKKQAIDIGKIYFLAFEITGVRDILPRGSSKLEKILKGRDALRLEKILQGNALAISFPHEVRRQVKVEKPAEVIKKPIVKEESGTGYYVWDKEKEQYVFKKADSPHISKKETKSIQPAVGEKRAVTVPWEVVGSQWNIGEVFVGGGSSGNGSIWTRENYSGNIHVGFDYYADTNDSEAILFIYGNGQDERIGYSFTLNPNWSAIRKNSFKDFLAHTDTVKMIPNRWHRIEAEVVGDQLKMFVDNNLILSVQDNSYSSGKVGFMVWWQSVGLRRIKNVRIEQPVVAEIHPSVVVTPQKKPSIVVDEKKPAVETPKPKKASEDWTSIIIWILPLIIGGIVSAVSYSTKTDLFLKLFTKIDNWIETKREDIRNEVGRGKIKNYGVRPFLWIVHWLKEFANIPKQEPIRYGIKTSLYLYLVGIAVFITLIGAYIIIVLLLLALGLWILGKILEYSEGARDVKIGRPTLLSQPLEPTFPFGKAINLRCKDKWVTVTEDGYMSGDLGGEYRLWKDGSIVDEGGKKVFKVYENGKIVDRYGKTAYEILDDGSVLDLRTGEMKKGQGLFKD